MDIFVAFCIQCEFLLHNSFAFYCSFDVNAISFRYYSRDGISLANCQFNIEHLPQVSIFGLSANPRFLQLTIIIVLLHFPSFAHFAHQIIIMNQYI